MAAQNRIGGSNARDLSLILERNDVRDTFRISFLANRLVLPVYDEIKRVHGLSRGEYLLLFCLCYMDELTAQDVADMTGRPRNSISRAVHRMLKEKYLVRAPDPADGRQALLQITKAGRQMNDRIIPLFRQAEDNMLQKLDQKDRQDLDRLLGKLVIGITD